MNPPTKPRQIIAELRKAGLRNIALIACAAILASVGCKSAPGKPGPDPDVPRPEQVVDFATLYGQNCAACHGVNGKNGAAIALANPIYLAIAGTANIQRVTSDGVSGTSMPPFAKAKGGMLTDQQIAILAAGMEQHWGNSNALAGQTPPPYASTAPGNPTQGQKAFTTFCARCHGADATGAQTDSSSSNGSIVEPAYLSLISDQGLRSIILAGRTEQGPHDWRSYLTGPGLTGTDARPMTDQEIAGVVAWLTSHRIATPGQPYREQP
jgi:mono/diheme cytochrome c family protein